MERRKSLFFNINEQWTKEDNQNFDVAMGTYDSAYLSYIIGLYVHLFFLRKAEKLTNKKQKISQGKRQQSVKMEIRILCIIKIFLGALVYINF